jgi:hypothetical protein
MVPERSNSRRSSNSPVIESKIAWVNSNDPDVFPRHKKIPAKRSEHSHDSDPEPGWTDT